MFLPPSLFFVLVLHRHVAPRRRRNMPAFHRFNDFVGSVYVHPSSVPLPLPCHETWKGAF